jgi:hypothetical protein
MRISGIATFDVDEHRVFFGRIGDVAALAGLLRSPAERAEAAVLLVVDPSACGKSSLVRAGLLATMADEPGWWTLPPILPGADPEAALADNWPPQLSHRSWDGRWRRCATSSTILVWLGWPMSCCSPPVWVAPAR